MIDKVQKRSVTRARVKGKSVLVRCGFDVPLSRGKVVDDARIRASLPTIRYLLEKGAKKIILMSHLGRPKGIDKALSLKPVAKRLSELLGRTVGFADTAIPTRPRVVLLENLRFNPGEKENDTGFAKQLAVHADVYVNDDFGIAHRKHASNNAIVKLLPSYVGFLPLTEVKNLSMVLKPKRPLTLVLGFGKISDKIDLLEKLLRKCDHALIGGAVCFTFLAALGYDVGKSRCEKDLIPLAKSLLKKHGSKIILPLDVVCAKTLDSVGKAYEVSEIPKSLAGFDIGPETVALFGDVVSQSQTIFWNGPVGVYEKKRFAKGTCSLAKRISLHSSTAGGCKCIVGGGDTGAAVIGCGFGDSMTHISTGGGASLAFLEKGSVASLQAIYKKTA